MTNEDTRRVDRVLAWATASNLAYDHARAHGRTVWNKDDYNVACDLYEKALAQCPLCNIPVTQEKELNATHA